MQDRGIEFSCLINLLSRPIIDIHCPSFKSHLEEGAEWFVQSCIHSNRDPLNLSYSAEGSGEVTS